MTRTLRRLFPTAAPPGVGAMSLLGCLCGIFAGLAISLLHWLIDTVRGLLHNLSFGVPADLWPAALIAPILGGILLGLYFQLLKPRHRHTGLVHIVERLMHHQGHLPSRNAYSNLIGTVIAVGSGQIVGREGAASHLGAAGASAIGRALELPNSTVRALVGCGAAAGIAASFNTPLAGVIFTMEVIIMEYSVMGLAPTIIAAVSANAVAHVWLSSHPTLQVSSTDLESLSQLPFLLGFGLILGLISAGYARGIAWVTKQLQTIPIGLSMAFTGAITAACAMALPLALSDGFENMNLALTGTLPLWPSLWLGLIVLLCSSLAIASAMPGGIIMPCMLAGACLGSAFGHGGELLLGLSGNDVALYALLGLAAMMGAVLQAPLTALIVVLELSGRTEMVFAAMLVVITAVMVNRQNSGAESIVALLIRNRGLDFRNDPVSQSLRRISVLAAMTREFAVSPPELTVLAARDILKERPQWLLVRPDEGAAYLVSAVDVQRAVSAADSEEKGAEAIISLAKIPADRRQCAPVHLRASLQEAWEALQSSGVEALYVERSTRHDQRDTYGILTREALEKAYRPI